MLYTDLAEAKSILEIDPNNSEEDKKLSFLIEMASSWIEEWLNRPGLLFKSRTEYYNGTGTQKLLLRNRPVYPDPIPRIFVDESGYYGADDTSSSAVPFDPSTTELTYGRDFTVKWDQDNGTSRSAIVIRLNAFWPKPTVRQAGYLSPFVGEGFGCIKAIYSGGYTVDTLPAGVRLAADMLIARLRYVLPLGLEMNAESYEERSISMVTSEKNKLFTLVGPLLASYRNYHF